RVFHVTGVQTCALPILLRHALLPVCLLAALPTLAEARGFDVRDLVSLERVSSPVLAPDGRSVVFAQRSVDAGLKATTALYARNQIGSASCSEIGVGAGA